MIQLGRAGLVADREDVERLRIQFAKTHLVRIPGMLDSQLLALALPYIEQGQWRNKVQLGNYSEYVLEAGGAVNLLHFVSNAPSFLKTISEITGSDLTWFEGRVYRMDPNAGHADQWHSDVADGRLIAMSLNLSPLGYQGGVFQMRERKSSRILAEVANTGLGDAILFRISRDFQHRVTDVQPGEPKTAFAGWFSTKPGMKERMSGDPPSRG
jgi:2OG-Fe(II) oxygenase superfamily